MARRIIACVLCLLAQCIASPLDRKEPCQFPAEWSGRWFQSGVQHYLTVNSTTIETKGHCLSHDPYTGKTVMEDRADKCWRCVVIHSKHYNVLQYKETYCYGENKGESWLCSQISGDAPLYSMFRADAQPVACPFHPPFTFSYNRGSGDCVTPQSVADACTEDSRLLLRYQACADVLNSESTVEELVCLAHWKDGSTRYLVGQVQHKMAMSDEEKYRCFVWEKKHNGGQNGKSVFNVAQSGDATCNGLLSPTEGSRTLRLTKMEHHERLPKNCTFPPWLTDHHSWHTLDHRITFQISHQNATMRENVHNSDNGLGDLKLKAVCHTKHDKDERPDRVKLVAHVTVGCQSGYSCFLFYKREKHVIEVQQSLNQTLHPDEACNLPHFNPQTLPFTTLISSSPEVRQCPFVGRYLVSEFETASASQQLLEEQVTCDQQYQALLVGCGPEHTMEFHSQCSSEAVSAYSCHADWTDSNATTRYLIASPLSRKSGGARRYCFVMYNSAEAGQNALLQVASVTESCHRHVLPGAGSGQYWAFNMTQHGKCGDSGGAYASPVAGVVLTATLCLVALSAVPR